MTIIGIAAENTHKTASILKKILSKPGAGVVSADSNEITPQILCDIKCSKAEYLIIYLKRGHIRPIGLDILILDNPDRIEPNLIKCVYSDTILIYNSDIRPGFRIMHPNAISYGMSFSSDATLSSIDDKIGGISIIFCLQKPIKNLLGDELYQGEFLVEISEKVINIEDILAIIVCVILCKIPTSENKNPAYLFI